MMIEEQKVPLSELEHFGVKGMHWGVHRDRMEKSTMSRDERKKVRKNFSKFALESALKKYSDDNPLGLERERISEQQYKNLSSKELVLKKGSTVARITRRKDETYADKGITYVSYKPGDRNIYRAIMPTLGAAGVFKFGGDKRYTNSYEVTLKATQNLKSPSEKARVDAFIDLMDTPSIKLRNGKVITGREHLKRAGFKKEVKTLDRTRLGLEFYKSFTEYQYTKDPINGAYYDSLRAKGYNSLVDDNDRGHLADTPLILLNPNGTVKKMRVKKLTADDVNVAQSRLPIDGESS